MVVGYANPIILGCGPRAVQAFDLTQPTMSPPASPRTASIFKENCASLLVVGLGVFAPAGQRSHIGTKVVKLQEGGRFVRHDGSIVHDDETFPVDVLPLASSKLMFLKVNNMSNGSIMLSSSNGHLASLIGLPNVATLRTRLSQWELLAPYFTDGAQVPLVYVLRPQTHMPSLPSFPALRPCPPSLPSLTLTLTLTKVQDPAWAVIISRSW
jgi:hypothetical protein